MCLNSGGLGLGLQLCFLALGSSTGSARGQSTSRSPAKNSGRAAEAVLCAFSFGSSQAVALEGAGRQGWHADQMHPGSVRKTILLSPSSAVSRG